MNLGLAYMVFTAFALGLTFHWAPMPGNQSISPEISWIGAVVLMFAAIVPSTPTKTLLAGVVAVSMNPIAMWIARARGSGTSNPRQTPCSCAFVTFSHDAGRSFGALRLDDAGALGRVDVELTPDGSAITSWIEFVDQRAQFRVRRVERSGARSPSVTVSSLAGSRASGYPRIGLSGDEVLFAWTEGAQSASRVQTAVARLPTKGR